MLDKGEKTFLITVKFKNIDVSNFRMRKSDVGRMLRSH